MFRASDAWCDEFQGRPDLSEFTAYQDHEVVCLWASAHGGSGGLGERAITRWALRASDAGTCT
jgi:hypothetical protein